MQVSVVDGGAAVEAGFGEAEPPTKPAPLPPPPQAYRVIKMYPGCIGRSMFVCGLHVHCVWYGLDVHACQCVCHTVCLDVGFVCV